VLLINKVQSLYVSLYILLCNQQQLVEFSPAENGDMINWSYLRYVIKLFQLLLKSSMHHALTPSWVRQCRS